MTKRGKASRRKPCAQRETWNFVSLCLALLSPHPQRTSLICRRNRQPHSETLRAIWDGQL